MADWLTIDGSQGEGGGQVLRSSLALAMVTGQPIRIDNIRAKRRPPGLKTQHLASVNAAARVAQATVTGALLGSVSLTFEPQCTIAGEYHIALGTAGSTSLVLQTILPALMIADGPSHVVLEGGTHNTHAPPFDFLAQSFLPLLARMGPQVVAQLDRAGFYPQGGGRCSYHIAPASLGSLELHERGRLCERSATALIANLPRHIADREIATLQGKLRWPKKDYAIREFSDARGPGNAVLVILEFEQLTEVITAFGERGVTAERVAQQAARETEQYLSHSAPVDEHLADQLMLPLALGAHLGSGGGSFRTSALSLHAQTQWKVLQTFLRFDGSLAEQDDGSLLVAAHPLASS